MSKTSIGLVGAILAGAVVGTGAAIAFVEHRASELPRRPPRITGGSLAYVPSVPELPPAEPSSAVPTLVEAGTEKIEHRVKALAAELSKMWTKHPEELVDVIEHASRSAPVSPSVTLLLAIAHAETNGNILDVSEAGAVGLAQATPIACRQEAIEGKLFVTSDYLIGARCYIMKKPLGDADTVASLVVDHDTPKTRARAKRLLKSARALRREGVDELDLLEPYALEHYFDSIRATDDHNRAVLRRLDALLDHGSRSEVRAFRDHVRHEYRAMKQTQLAAWSGYQYDLAAKRDRMLETHFGEDAKSVKRNRPYEASEYLGENLDIRFSAQSMAAFLVQHLEHKAEEARQLASSDREVEAMTAALYNGGSHNVKRMLAGLIASLPETQRYMKKVPATRRRLDATIAVADAAAAESTEMRTLR